MSVQWYCHWQLSKNPSAFIMELIQQYSFDMLYDSVTLKVELHGHEADIFRNIFGKNSWLETEAHSQDIHWWVKTADWQSVKTAGGLFKELHCLFWSFTVKNMKRVILTWLFPSGIWSWLVSLFDRLIKNTSKKTNSLDIWQTKGQELTMLEDLSTS